MKRKGPRLVLGVLGPALLAAALSGPAAAQADQLKGVFNFIEDTDGGKPEAGAIITISFSDGHAVFSSLRPGQVQADQGVYTIQSNRITIRFDNLLLGCGDKVFIFDGQSLTLPFKVLSAGEGYSIWKKTGAAEPGGGSGKDGRNGRDRGDGKGMIELFSELEGDWAGKGAGAEVRFRREATIGRGKFNVMTLTTKHATEFFFHIFPDQHIEGEGVILYNLEPDLSGVDALAGAIKGMLGAMPIPSVPSLKEGNWGKAAGQMSDKMAAGTLSAPGVTSPSYSYKMKNAPQQRHFEIRGKVYKVQYNLYKIHLEVSGDYYRSADLSEADGKLWVVYEVNLAKDEKSFPTWSPFLTSQEGDGIIRKSSGETIYMVDSEFSGKHRDGVKPWEEYTFSWSARKTTS
jgi:hypothetical protein